MKKILLSGIIFLLFSLDVKAEIKPLLPEEESKATVYFETYPSVVDLLKEEIHETKHWDENCSDTTIKVSYEDAQRLMRIAVSEAESEGVYGQYLIMQVILNRLKSDEFPDSIEEIISQRLWKKDHWVYQFDSYANGRYQSAEPNVDSHLALAEIEKNLSDADDEIIAFETTINGEVLNRWFDMKFTYLNHNFYTKKED